jgi:deoxyribonuclease-4
VQIFTKNASQWSAKPLDDDSIGKFRSAVAESGLQHATAHDSYLINLASPDDALYRKSIEAFVDELQRAEVLGLEYLVTHPGAHMGNGEEVGIARVVAALDEVHQRTQGFHVMVLLENTAGQGTTLGHRFEHLAAMLDRVADTARLGVCFDTCHAFAAGYPLAAARDYARTMAEFDELIGLDRLRLFHLNDSVKPLGCRVDRHAAIGKGAMGLEPFRRIVRDRRFGDRPMILETPKEDADGKPMDSVNLGVLRGLVRRR